MTDPLLQTLDSRLRRLYGYWNERRQGRAFPARRDLDPTDFAYILGHVLLIEALYDPLRFRFRLHGSELARRAGYDMTGKWADALPGDENRMVLLERCRSLVQERRPQMARMARVLDGDMYRYEVMWVPLSDDGDTINMLLGALVYSDAPALQHA